MLTKEQEAKIVKEHKKFMEKVPAIKNAIRKVYSKASADLENLELALGKLTSASHEEAVEVIESLEKEYEVKKESKPKVKEPKGNQDA